MSKLRHIIQRFKCMIGWHLPGVYGHVENDEVEVKEILKEEPDLVAYYNPEYEYYLCCIACNKTFSWNFQFKITIEYKGNTKYVPVVPVESVESKEDELR